MDHPLLRRHSDTLLALALFGGVLTVYLRTLCPSLYWGDCGELATVAAILGIPHPTGYPLYCLLGKLWTLILPVGSIAWRMNAFSALCGSLAVMCLYGFARVITLPRPLALTTGGVLAFSFTFWQQSLLTETYTLAALCTCLLLFLAARWRAHGCQPRDLHLLAVAYGFALTCHQTNTLFLPGFAAFVLWSQPTLLRLHTSAIRRQWATTLGLGTLPLLTYLYLPLRARMHPAYNWGDIETPFAFFYHVTGRAYSSVMFQQTLPAFARIPKIYAEHLHLEFTWPLIVAAAPGLFLFWRRVEERPLAGLLSWMFVADLLFVANYNIYNGYIYYIPSYIVISACAGRGLLGLWETLEPRLAHKKRPAFAAFAALGALALIPLQAVAHRQVNLSGNWTCYDYGRNLLASVPPHGVLVINADDTASGALAYLQIIEGRRPDVAVVQRGLLRALYDPNCHEWANFWAMQDLERHYPPVKTLYPSHSISIVQAITEDPLRRLIRDAVTRHVPVCVLAPAGGPQWFMAAHPMIENDGTEISFNEYLRGRYDLTTIGLVTRVFPHKQSPSRAALQAETERVWHAYSLRGVFDGRLQSDQFLLMVALNYGHGSLARAQAAYDQGYYATAAHAYSDVLTLFTSDEAEQGLQRCAHARRQPAQKIAAGSF